LMPSLEPKRLWLAFLFPQFRPVGHNLATKGERSATKRRPRSRINATGAGVYRWFSENTCDARFLKPSKLLVNYLGSLGGVVSSSRFFLGENSSSFGDKGRACCPTGPRHCGCFFRGCVDDALDKTLFHGLYP